MFTVGLSNFEPGATFALGSGSQIGFAQRSVTKRAKHYARSLVLKNTADVQITSSLAGFQLNAAGLLTPRAAVDEIGVA